MNEEELETQALEQFNKAMAAGSFSLVRQTGLTRRMGPRPNSAVGVSVSGRMGPNPLLAVTVMAGH